MEGPESTAHTDVMKPALHAAGREEEAEREIKQHFEYHSTERVDHHDDHDDDPEHRHRGDKDIKFSPHHEGVHGMFDYHHGDEHYHGAEYSDGHYQTYEDAPTHHFDEHFWIDPAAKTPEEEHNSEYFWTSDHHYIPESDHESHQHDFWERSEVHLVDIVEPMQHYYSDPIRHEELHLVKPVHYERDLYIDPETKHETLLV